MADSHSHLDTPESCESEYSDTDIKFVSPMYVSPMYGFNDGREGKEQKSFVSTLADSMFELTNSTSSNNLNNLNNMNNLSSSNNGNNDRNGNGSNSIERRGVSFSEKSDNTYSRENASKSGSGVFPRQTNKTPSPDLKSMISGPGSGIEVQSPDIPPLELSHPLPMHPLHPLHPNPLSMPMPSPIQPVRDSSSNLINPTTYNNTNHTNIVYNTNISNNSHNSNNGYNTTNSQGSVSPVTPTSPDTAYSNRQPASIFPHLVPASRPASLTIPVPSHPVPLHPGLVRALSLGVNSSEVNSSRSRQNSDTSENYDILLGVDNTFSLDNDDSQRKLNIDHSVNNSFSEDESLDNLSGINRSSSTGRPYPDRRNRPVATVLRSLGPPAKENITPQQLTILLRMRELLETGVEVLKHGRGGRPKRSVLFCEPEFTKLYWRRPVEGRSAS